MGQKDTDMHEKYSHSLGKKTLGQIKFIICMKISQITNEGHFSCYSIA